MDESRENLGRFLRHGQISKDFKESLVFLGRLSFTESLKTYERNYLGPGVLELKNVYQSLTTILGEKYFARFAIHLLRALPRTSKDRVHHLAKIHEEILQLPWDEEIKRAITKDWACFNQKY